MSAPRPLPTVPRDAARWMDALRAILAMTVAFSHGWGMMVVDHRGGDAWIGHPFYFVAGYGHPAVMLFFVLSGFWIAKSVASLDARGWSWRIYMIDRLSRLGIVVLPALLIGGLLDSTGLYLLRTPTHLGETHVWFFARDLGEALSPRVLLGNLTFLQNILVPPFGSNSPLWSVAFEFWYYIWFAALWIAIRRRRPEPLLLTLALGWVSFDLAYGFLAWLTGAAAYHLTGRLTGSRKWLLPLGILLVGVLVWARLGDWLGEDVIVACSAALFLVAFVARDPAFPHILTPLAKFGANSSFSLYALHFPIMVMVTALIVGHNRLQPDMGSIALVLCLVAVATLFAGVFSQFTEARTGQLRDILRRRMRVATPAA